MASEFQKKVMQALAMSAGPAALDIAKDVCAKMGVSPDALTPAHMDKFTSLIEADLAEFLSASDVKATVAQLRSLR